MWKSTRRKLGTPAFAAAAVVSFGAWVGVPSLAAAADGGAPAAEPAESKPSRIRLGGSVQAAKILSRVQPVYPESAKSAGAQGTVVLHAVVGKDGRLLSLHVLNSQIDPDLARSAVEAVSQWRYTPTLLNGEPIEIDTSIEVVFSLQH